MMTKHFTFARFCSAVRRKGALALCLVLCTLGLRLSASAQEPQITTFDAPRAGTIANDYNGTFSTGINLLGTVAGVVEIGGTQTTTNIPNNFASRQRGYLIGPVVPRGIKPAAGAAAPALETKEVVLHNFASPPHGAYPSNGVIRDSAGNLYGTTNGAYSGVGGGGTNNAGVVFKIDKSGNETVLYSFTGGADGSSPNGLIRDSASNLYGTTTYGGTSGAGVVFKVDASGDEKVLYTFTGGADGGNPYADLIRDSADNLYGTTNVGGASGWGVVFKVDTSGHETVLYSFTGGADGGNPNGVIRDWAGNFYGTTTYGGSASGTSGWGVVFKLDTSGKETVLYTFTGGADGGNSDAGVIRDAAGNLYGTTVSGGSASGESGWGVVFKVDRSGHETVLYTFTGGADGGNPFAGVIFGPAGILYGTTNSGGTAALGVVFKVDTSGNETVLHTFMRGPYGNQPYLAGVILDSVGNLYGTTAFSGAGGQGAVYKLDTSGNATVLYAFPGAADGQFPYNAGVIFGSDCHLYGATQYGGKSGAGVVYQLDGDGNEKVLYSFAFFTANGFGQPTGNLIQDSEGNFYGTTFIGQADVGYGYGVVYKLDTAGHSTVLHNFTNGADGGDPYGGVIRDSKGNLYGTANGGTSGAGVVFKVDTSGHETVLYSFTGGANGGSPLGGVIRDSKGNLYGTTELGGTSGAGVVFKVDTAGTERVLHSFTGGADGGYPIAGVIRDAKGNLYGTANGGGTSGAGVVFKVDTSGHETVLYSFTGGADGGYPLWVVLARDSAGNLYGTTSGGGASNAGVVFKVNAAGQETVLHSFTGGADGGTPYAGVILGPKGNLYGTTGSGGQTNTGVVFEVKP
jgi:uncharacterized repeat protein (TIGR03803 family)